MNKLSIKTSKQKQVVDISDRIQKLIDQSNLESGVCHVFITHTTASLTTADLDPGTDLDMLDAIGEVIPKLNYRHPHDPSHVDEHIASSLIGSSVSIPFLDGRLILGTWQRIVLIELNGPKERQVVVNLVK